MAQNAFLRKSGSERLERKPNNDQWLNGLASTELYKLGRPGPIDQAPADLANGANGFFRAV
jgi:hypothetical protein